MIQIILKTETYQLKEGTKGAYKLTEIETEEIEDRNVKLLEESCKYFRRLGGSETLTYGYTCQGYKPIKLISKSPDRKTKRVRTIEYKYIND